MSNLLDKASIILTPTAYKNSRVMCVKPSDASGDFTFSRNSAATRVNAQGLVENVQILSSNLVQNGDFSEEGVEEVSNGSFSQEGEELITNGDFSSDTGWIKGTGWTISGGSLNGSSSTSSTYQNNSLVNGTMYKATYTVSNYVSGSVQIKLGGSLGQARTANGTYTEYLTATQVITWIVGNNFTGSIDNCSVREVGQDWILQTGWSIGEDKAVANTTGSTNGLLQTSTITSGKIYKATFEVLDYQSGSVRINLGGAGLTGVGNLVSANGVYTQYITSDGVDVYMQGRVGFIGSITNISVKEVLQDWSVEDYGAVSASAVITPYTEGVKLEKTVSADWRSSFLIQPISYTNGSKYKVTFKLKNGNLPSGGSVFVRALYDSSSHSIVTNLALTNDWVEYTYYYIADSNSLDISFGNVDWQNAGVGEYFYIDDVSITEITDDTNLPRISYENFSYQDALGSEEVVNGTFEQSGIGNALSQSGGILVNENNQLKITSNGSSGFSRAVWNTNGLEGEQFLIKADIISKSGSTRFINISNNAGQGLVQGTTFSTIITLGGSGNQIGFGGLSDTSFELVIDNVSVKKYSGQEVVPGSGCGSWLFEPASRNLLPYSEDFSNSAWSKIRCTIDSGGHTSPSGESNAFKMTATDNDARLQDGNFATGVIYTQSIYVKSATGSDVSGQVDFSGTQIVTFTATDQWQRVTTTSDNTRAGLVRVRITNSGDELYVWGAQLEQQSYATSYIPNFGEANGVSRNQDLCTNGGSLASINSTEGTLYGEFSTIANDNNSNWINISDGTPNNWLFVGRDNDKVRVYLRANNAVVLSNMITPLSNNNKVALSYKSGDIRAYINGVEIVNLTSAFAFTSALNTLDFNAYNGGGTTTQIAWKALAVWKEALSDQELADLTYPTPTDPTFALNFDTIATDFTFARNSEATYVDAQGLIKSTNELGAEVGY